MRELSCLRCGSEMVHLRREFIQLGRTGWLRGDLSNLLAGALDVDIYCCAECGKLEFYRAEESERTTGDGIAQRKCPQCGHMHDMDYPKCPFCRYKYEE